MSEPTDVTSPACAAHEADDAYMGFASGREIAAFLQALAAAEAAGRPLAALLRDMLPRIRDDVLHGELKRRLEGEESPKSNT